jgi:dipeptidyl aminopeptidase/acylaminoacyl peptidase
MSVVKRETRGPAHSERMSLVHKPVMFLLPILLLVVARPARAEGFTLAHPDDPSKHVEYFVEKPEGKGPWPTIVLLHGHQETERVGGKIFVQWGVLDQFAKRGVLAVAVSEPGYGNSTVPSDFCGELTQHAVAAVIAKLRADGMIAPRGLVVEGISRGAIVAGLVAAHDPSIAGLVLISGEYDLAALAADTTATGAKAGVRETLLKEMGGRSDALKARSVINFAKDIKAATLVLNGAKDDRTDPEHARRLAKDMSASGGKARVIIYPDYGHQIPVDVRNRDIEPFLAQVWGAR